jgi:hypothetical protein
VRDKMRFISSETGIHPSIVLYIRANGANSSTTFKDDSPSHKSITPTNAVISTTISKFGGSCAYFDGTGDYLTLPQSTDLALSTAAYTISFWIYFKTVKACTFYTANSAGSAPNSLYIQFYDNKLALGKNDVGNIYAITWAPDADKWYYLLFNRSGNVHTSFVNGTQHGQGTDAVNLVQNGSKIGAGGGGDCHAYIDDFRIINGIAIDGTKVPTRSMI